MMFSPPYEAVECAAYNARVLSVQAKSSSVCTSVEQTRFARWKAPHQKKYGNDFADSFFRHESGARELSLDEVERRLATAKAEVERLEGKRTELIQAAEMDAKARAEAEKKAKAAKLEAAEKAAAEAAAHLAALKAELGDS